ncbi:hypothetical protein GEMRC1_004046 [Eukaryota sp. GEM-RC1]
MSSSSPDDGLTLTQLAARAQRSSPRTKKPIKKSLVDGSSDDDLPLSQLSETVTRRRSTRVKTTKVPATELQSDLDFDSDSEPQSSKTKLSSAKPKRRKPQLLLKLNLNPPV